MEKNVIVMDDTLQRISLTYPKRARGLVKKGRAEWMNDYQIRLCSTKHKETMTMAHALYFDPKAYVPFSGIEENHFTREMVQSFLGSEQKQVLSLGSFEEKEGLAISAPLTLEKNTEYCLTFWLRNPFPRHCHAIAELRILATDSVDTIQAPTEELVYRFGSPECVQPIKHCKGWRLYAIEIHTGEEEYTYLKFHAKNAPMTIMSAGNAADYASLVSDPIPEDFPPFLPDEHCGQPMPPHRPGEHMPPPPPHHPGMPPHPHPDHRPPHPPHGGPDFPSPHRPHGADHARVELLHLVGRQIERLDYSQPYSVDILKELKDIVERTLRSTPMDWNSESRNALLGEVQGRMDQIDSAQPYAADALKETKDMVQRLMQ